MSSSIDKLAWIHVENRRVLCARSFGKEAFYIPGGKREPDESDQDALIREVREELSVDLLPDTIAFLGVFSAQADGKPSGTIVRMTCYTGGFTGTVTPAMEIEEVVWLEHTDRSRCSLVTRGILDHLKQADLID